MYWATAVTAPSIVNAMDFCPRVCAAPFTVHCEKAYPAGSAAGAWRFTLVPLATPAFVKFVVPLWPVLELITIPVGGVDSTVNV